MFWCLSSRSSFSLFQRDVVLSEPAIQVRRKGKGKQIWALEKMENRLVDMRELYQEWKDFDEDNPVSAHRCYTDIMPYLSSSTRCKSSCDKWRLIVKVKILSFDC